MDVEIESFRDYRLSNSLEEKLSYRPDIDALLETGGISAQGIEAIIASATENLAEVRIEIFGDNTDAHDYETLEGTDVVIEDTSDQGFFESIGSAIGDMVQNVSDFFTGEDNSTEYETVTKTIRSLEGDFNHHVGYAPEMMSDVDMEDALSESKFRSKIKFQGTGEMGRIMLAYQRYNTIEGEAWNRFGAALWEQRLWDDDGSDFKAPTIKNIMDIGISIVGMALGGGVGAAVLNMIDDAIFTTADIVNGRKSATEGIVDFGISAASSLAVAAIGEIGSGIGDAINAQTAVLDAAGNTVTDAAGNVVMEYVQDAGTRMAQNTLLSVGKQFVSNTANGALNAISYSDKGGFGWDNSIFANSVFGASAMAGYVGTIANSLTTYGMNELTLKDGDGTGLASTVFDTQSIGSLNNFVGDLSSMGVEYLFTGNTSINILNSSMFGLTDGKGNGTGLLELSFGRDGFGASISTGGTNFSIDRLGKVLDGLSSAASVIGAKAGSLLGNNERLALLNSTNMLGYTSDARNWKTAKDIWNGDIKTTFIDKGETGDGFEIFGEAMEDGSIQIDDRFLALGMENAAQLAAVLGHEGLHVGFAAGEKEAYTQSANVYEELADIFEGQIGDGEFREALSNGMIQHYFDDMSVEEAQYMLRMLETTRDGVILGVRPNTPFDDYNRIITDDFPILGSIESALIGVVRNLQDIVGEDPEGIAFPLTQAEMQNYANGRVGEGINILLTAISVGFAANGAMAAAEGIGGKSVITEFVKNLLIPGNPANIGSAFDAASTAYSWYGVWGEVNRHTPGLLESIGQAFGYDPNYVNDGEIFDEMSHSTKARAIETLYAEAMTAGSVSNIDAYTDNRTDKVDETVFSIAQQLNIPLQMELTPEEMKALTDVDSRLPVMIIDQLQRNYQFLTVASMEYKLDLDEIDFLYRGGVSEVKTYQHPVHETYYNVAYGVPGFSSLNVGPLDLNQGYFEEQMRLINGYIDVQRTYDSSDPIWSSDYYNYREYLFENRSSFEEAWTNKYQGFSSYDFNRMMSDIINHQW